MKKQEILEHFIVAAIPVPPVLCQIRRLIAVWGKPEVSSPAQEQLEELGEEDHHVFPSSSHPRFLWGGQCRTEIRTHVLRTFCGFVVGDSKHENPYFCLYIFPFFSGSPSEFPRTVYAYTLYRAPVHKLPFSKVSLVFKLSNSQSILAILKFGRLALNSLTKKTRFT